MRGLDPRIHHFSKKMDGRVKPGHDDSLAGISTLAGVKPGVLNPKFALGCSAFLSELRI